MSEEEKKVEETTEATTEAATEEKAVEVPEKFKKLVKFIFISF